MKKKLLIIGAIVLVVIIIVIILVSTKKKPGTTALTIGTKYIVKSSKLENDGIVSMSKSEVKTTNNATGKTGVEEHYTFTAKKKGSTTLTLECVESATNKEVTKVYDIVVDNKLKVTINDR